MKTRLLTLLALAVSVTPSAWATDQLTRGQTLYLPVYSHIWHGDRVVEGKYPLKNLVSSLVSVRNTSLKTPIRVVSARYYNTEGQQLKEYITTPRRVPPMGTLELFVEKKDSAGGSGANFIIEWESDTVTNPPVVEAVHADIKGHQTLAFVTTAKIIKADK